MATIEEQLSQVRLAYIEKLYEGQPQQVIKAATKNVDRMSFDTVEDFEEWADETYQSDPKREANAAEINEISEYMGLGKSDEDPRTQSEKDIDEIMKGI